VRREPVDPGQVRVVGQLGDPADDADVPIPTVVVHHGQRDARVPPQVLDALAAGVHVDQDPVAVEDVPRGDRDRLPVPWPF
jgi:hypothetical protein